MATPSPGMNAAVRRLGGLVCGAVLIVFTGLVLYSVVMRYFFSAPPIWGEEIPKLLFVWMIFVGAGFAYLAGANIRMTLIIDLVPRRPRLAIELVMHLLVVAMLLVILWYSVPIVQLTSNFTSLATGISEGWKYLALPVGAVLLLANEVYRIYRILRGHVDRHDVVADEQI